MNLQEQTNRIKKLMGIITEQEQNDTQNNILYPLSTGGAKTLILLPGSGENGGQGDSDFNEFWNLSHIVQQYYPKIVGTIYDNE